MKTTTFNVACERPGDSYVFKVMFFSFPCSQATFNDFTAHFREFCLFRWMAYSHLHTVLECFLNLKSHARNSHPKGDGGSGRRPLPPDHLTF